jgi:hypothetical protein
MWSKQSPQEVGWRHLINRMARNGISEEVLVLKKAIIFPHLT